MDDEPRARQLLQAVLKDHCPQCEILAQCDDLPSAIKAIHKHKPDLVFLDIEMPGHSGLEILDFFPEGNLPCAVIFVTAYSEYAIQAIRLAAMDYLLKPVDVKLLREAVERFARRREQQEQQREPKNGNGHVEKVGIPQGQAIRFYATEDLVMIKGEGAYSELFLKSGEQVLVTRNLKLMEEILLDFPQFCRCHRSYIVNARHISTYSRSDGGYVMLDEKYHVPVAADKLDELLQRMKG